MMKQTCITPSNKNTLKAKRTLPVHVTDDMMVSVIYDCVRASRKMSSIHAFLEERRRPLHAACQILLTLAKRHGFSVETGHYNPLAAAYQKLQLPQ
mmetsp:Transcript_11196/g.14733  ORF Transcript_11196/g.14733 Transcript_11196/m.14733 type:complete len:96 (-) Transcript_11196:359-646(-)